MGPSYHLSYFYGLIFSCHSPSSPQKCHHLSLQKFERDILTEYFQYLLLEEGAIYTLFGSKPFTIVPYYNRSPIPKAPSTQTFLQNLDPYMQKHVNTYSHSWISKDTPIDLGKHTSQTAYRNFFLHSTGRRDCNCKQRNPPYPPLKILQLIFQTP